MFPSAFRFPVLVSRQSGRPFFTKVSSVPPAGLRADEVSWSLSAHYQSVRHLQQEVQVPLPLGQVRE